MRPSHIVVAIAVTGSACYCGWTPAEIFDGGDADSGFGGGTNGAGGGAAGGSPGGGRGGGGGAGGACRAVQAACTVRGECCGALACAQIGGLVATRCCATSGMACSDNSDCCGTLACDNDACR